MNRKREKIERGIFLIDGRIYLERTFNGRVMRRKALVQGENALRRGKPTKALMDEFESFCDMVDNKRFEDLQASKQRSEAPTLQALITAYRKAAEAEYSANGMPRPATVDINVGSMKLIAEGCGVGLDGRIDKLDRDAIQSYIDTRCDGSDRSRRSAWSALAHAKSLFAKWVIVRYDALRIRIPECCKEWPNQPKTGMVMEYERPTKELRDATMTWYNGLEEKNPTMWAAVTLMVQFAMRPVDAAELRWDSFQRDGECWVLKYVPSKTRGRTSRPRPVLWPVTDDLYNRLRKAGGQEYLVDHPLPYLRYAYYIRFINAEMRRIGWDREKYRKACYELRKLCVDAIYHNMGAEKASQISGDNIQTVIKYYADRNRCGFEGVDVSKMI
jgi:integrase